MRKYLPVVILFGVIVTVYTICCTPDFTWANIDCDGFYYYNKVVHLVDWGTQPVYAGLGHAVVHIPIGTMPWRAAFFVSTLPAVITAALVFFIVRKQTNNKWAPYIGATAFAASPIVISQATVHEIYSMVAMFCTTAYLLHVYKRHTLSLVVLGVAACTYILAIPAVLIAFVLWTPSKRKLPILIPFILAPFFLEHYFGFYSDVLGYWATLPGVLFHGEVSGVPLRLIQTLGILTIAMGAAWLPAFLHLRNWRKALPFYVILALPVLHLLTCPCVEGYVQLYSASPFLAIAAGLGVAKLRTKALAPAVLTVSCLTLVITPAFWDVGRTLDRSPTTARVLLQQMTEVPNGSMILCSRQFEGAEDSVGMLNRSAVETLNRELGKNLQYVNPNLYCSIDDYWGERERLRSLGLSTPYVPYVPGTDCWTHQSVNMRAFAEANGDIGVYYTVVTEPEVFGCELVKLN